MTYNVTADRLIDGDGKDRGPIDWQGEADDALEAMWLAAEAAGVSLPLVRGCVFEKGVVAPL